MPPHIEELKTRITCTLKRHDVARAAIFGSFARGDAEENSDLDLLVEFKGEKSLLDLVGLKLELEDSLGRSVDVLTYNALHPAIRDRILSEQVMVL
jgi:predicted nucleotidyltransferase